MKQTDFGIKSTEAGEIQFSDEDFEKFRIDFRKDFPVLFQILHTLFPVDVNEYTRRKELSTIHALSLLSSLQNPYAPNDMRLMFSILLLSFGVGCRLMNMLCRMNLTLNWKSLDNFLMKQMERREQSLEALTPIDMPIMYLLDNINMYRGAKKYLRLFRVMGPKMWNFTGSGIIIPKLSGIEHLFQSQETALNSQKDVLSVVLDDILIENNKEHNELWQKWLDQYLLSGLSKAINKLPHGSKLKDMSQNDFNKWLSTKAYEADNDDPIVKINLPDNKELLINDESVGKEKTKTRILPLSLENNATIAGTAAILKDIANTFQIPCEEKTEYIPFDVHSKKFSIKHAREHFEFMRIIHEHTDEMAEFERVLSDTEKIVTKRAENEELDTSLTENQLDELFQEFDMHPIGDGDDDEVEVQREGKDLADDGDTVPVATLRSKKTSFRMEDRLFSRTYDSLQNKMWRMSELGRIDQLLLDLRSNEEKEHMQVKDHFGRSLLHVAVEQNNFNLVEVLLSVGLNPNAKEHCGATPLTLAVIDGNVKMTQILVDAGASCSGPLFLEIPSPMDIALKLQYAELVEIMNKISSSMVDLDLQRYDPYMKDNTSVSQPTETTGPVKVNRSSKGFLTPIIGDVGTCKTTRGTTERSTAYDWATTVPGDMHMKGSLCESCYKEQGDGGLLYLTKVVMNRPQLNPETFKDKKYEKNNLRHIKDAVRDCSQSYLLAAIVEFHSSNYYPSPRELKKALRKDGNHNNILLTAFREWLKAADKNVSMKYRAHMFMHYGPLLELFDFSTSYSWGLGRETCYILHMPSYCQLGLRNYYTESFIHTINFLFKWPVALRRMLQINSSVNLSGKIGCGMENDAWVETFIVQPTKRNTKGQSTVKTCQRIVGNLDLVDNIRKAYTGRQAFDEHTTKRHSIPSSFPDQMKGAWYCVKNKLFDSNENSEDPKCVGSKGNVKKVFINVQEKGIEKMRSNFHKKIYDFFPDLKYCILHRYSEETNC